MATQIEEKEKTTNSVQGSIEEQIKTQEESLTKQITIY